MKKMKIKEIRLEKFWTQKQLAEMVDVSQSTLARWENGNQDVPLDKLQKLAEVLNVSVDELKEKPTDLLEVIIRQAHSIAEKSPQIAIAYAQKLAGCINSKEETILALLQLSLDSHTELQCIYPLLNEGETEDNWIENKKYVFAFITALNYKKD